MIFSISIVPAFLLYITNIAKPIAASAAATVKTNKEIICPDNLLNIAHKKKGVKAGIVNAGKPLPMQSVQDAVKVATAFN